MSFLLKDTIHRSLADSVYNEFLSGRSIYYYFIGNIIEWTDPNFPDAPEITQDYEYNTRNGILSVRKLNLRSVSYVVPRIDWVTGTVYDQYDGNYSETEPANSGATSLKTANFYVLTSSFNVYKCIFNNNNSPSTEEPSGQDITMITTSDGYVWKYLYTIPLSSQNRFLTQDYMPVQRAVTNAYYSRGEISSVIIDSPGTGYLGNAEVTLTVEGEFNSGTGNAIANLRPVLNAAGEFIDVLIDDPGANYKYATIKITDNLGAGASHNNAVSNVRIFSGGSGYTAAAIANTTAVFTTTGSVQPSANAAANLIFNGGSLVDIELINKGNQYSAAARANTTLVISTTGSSQPTVNATANIFYTDTAVLVPRMANGSIQGVIIEDQGKGYSSNIQTTIQVAGDGTGAVLTPFINNAGELEDIIIEDRGQGYTYANLTVVGDGTGANARVNLSTEDLDTLQTVVELSAVNGGLHAFRVTNGGDNYSTANISVIGDGTGFSGDVVLVNNTVSYVTVTVPGVGYSYANVIITGDGSNANVSAIISPYKGHGSDPVRELFADTLMFVSSINNERNHNILISNDYRQFGIIKDLKRFGNDRAFANVEGSACYLVTMDTVSGLANDDELTHIAGGSRRVFEIVEVIPATNQLLLLDKNNHDVAVNDILTDESTELEYAIQSIDNFPDINKFSGDLLYIDNRTSVSHTGQQIVTLRTVIRF